jgi:malonate transporter
MSLLQSLFSILAIISIGVFCGRSKLFTEAQTEGLELLLFKIAIPCFLFSSIINNKFSNLFNKQYVYCYLLTFFTIALITTIYFWRKTSPAELCIKMLASGYVNTAIYSLPMITFLLGDPKAAILGNLIQVTVIQSTLVTLLGFLKHKEKSVTQRLLTTFRSPLVAIPIIGMTVDCLQWTVPPIIMTVTQNLGSGATSLALFTFGLTLSNIKINRNNLDKELFFVLLTKNILHPLIATVIAFYIFTLEKYWLYSLIITGSAPTAFMVYLIAKQFSTDAHFVKVVVTTSSVVSLISLLFITSIIG